MLTLTLELARPVCGYSATAVRMITLWWWPWYPHHQTLLQYLFSYHSSLWYWLGLDTFTTTTLQFGYSVAEIAHRSTFGNQDFFCNGSCTKLNGHRHERVTPLTPAAIRLMLNSVLFESVHKTNLLPMTISSLPVVKRLINSSPSLSFKAVNPFWRMFLNSVSFVRLTEPWRVTRDKVIIFQKLDPLGINDCLNSLTFVQLQSWR